MKHLKPFNEKYTLSDLVGDKYDIFNSSASSDRRSYPGRGKDVPGLVKSRTWSGLLLLTQVTKSDQNLTDLIVQIAKILDPIMQDIGTYSMEKYNNLTNPKSSLHNRDFDEQLYADRLVALYPSLDYILNWYTESDDESPFDILKYANLCLKMKAEAEKVFDKSIWSKSKNK